MITFTVLCEEVILFPTSARLDEKSGNWSIPVRGWIFEREKDSLWRSTVLKGLAKLLELPEGVEENRLFCERARMFLVDNERWKNPDIRIGSQVFTMNRSKPNGHFEGMAAIGKTEAEKLASGGRLSLSVVMQRGDERQFVGLAQILPEKGVSVISDIDDTIKESNVLDRNELLANTFLREYRAIPGMADVYEKWRQAGAAFHYVSSSPWQLYPFLSDFMEKNGFPRGGFHLKQFRIKDRSFFSLFTSSEKTKPPVIASILNNFPKRKYIMVGDSGENDPEIYGAFAGKYPERVIHVFIRKVPGADNGTDRFSAAFNGVEKNRWTVFEKPENLSGIELAR